MKKLLTLTLVSILLLTLASCGQIPADKNRGGDSTDEPQTVVTTTDEPQTPDTTAPQTPDTTKAPESTKAPATTKAPESTKAPATTKAPEPTKPAHKHTYTTNVQKATCTANGRKIYTCACGDAYSETLKATGHKWGNWKIQTLPSTTANGKDVRTCSACSAQETKATGKLLSRNSFYTDKNNYYTAGEVSIRPRAMYWSEDGCLYAECLVINGLDTTVSNIIVNELTFSVNGQKVASENFGMQAGVTIPSHCHEVRTFRFDPRTIANYGVNLSTNSCYANVKYDH